VEMVDGLAAVGAGVYDYSIAFGQAFGAGDLCRRPDEVADQLFVVGVGFSQRNNMLARRDEDVDWGLRMNVRESVALVVLVDGGGWNGAVNDLAEEAAHGVTSVQQA